MTSGTRKKKKRIVFLTLIGLLLLFGRETKAKDQAKFTIERMTSDQGPIASEMWTVGTAIIMTEPISLPTPCDQVDGEVNVQGRKIVVKVKPVEKISPHNAECNQTAVETGVKVMIRDLPIGSFSVTLETPQKVTTGNLLIDW